MMKRVLAIILIISLTMIFYLNSAIVYGADYDSQMAYSIYRTLKLANLKAPSYAVIEFKNGQLLFEKNSNQQRPVAGLAKLMTIYIALDNIKNGNRALSDKIMATANSVGVKGNTAFVYAGEKFTLESALKAVIINNCNDVTIAIAENIAGSEAEFVKQMNAKAKELGMKNTVFVDSTGLNDDGKSTAYDMALLSRALVLNHPDYLNYSKIWMDTFRDGKFNLYNTNRLIKFLPESDGLKYGYSEGSKNCMASTIMKDDRRVVAVALGLEDENTIVAESRFLLEYALENYSMTELVDDGAFVKDVKVKKGVEKSVKSIIKGSARYVLTEEEKNKIELVTDVKEEIEAPVKKGDKLGTVTYKLGDKELAVVDIVAEKDVKKASWLQLLIQWILEWFGLE